MAFTFHSKWTDVNQLCTCVAMAGGSIHLISTFVTFRVTPIISLHYPVIFVAAKRMILIMWLV